MGKGTDILLATYNSERYIVEQIESLLGQTCSNWHLIVRDDNSSDRTIDILRSYEKNCPDRIRVFADTKHLGACQSFASLIELSDADYVMFCDQDDIWLPKKIELSLNAMKEMERKFGANFPLLVHTDLRVVDQDLNTIGDSFWSYQNMRISGWDKLNQILVKNNVTGCTVLINRHLKKLAMPIPCDAIMHDWWIALVSSAFGISRGIAEQTVLYRQHGRNQVGAKKWNSSRIGAYAKNKGYINGRLERKQLQARAFLERYKWQLDEHQAEIVSAFAYLSKQGYFKRRYNLLKYSLLDMGLLRNIGMLLFG